MLSIHDELRAIAPVALAFPGGVDKGPELSATESDLDAVAKMLGRLGKQQLRTNQQVELAVEQLQEALKTSQVAQVALKEQADEYRRQVQRLEADARDSRLASLATIDALDDLRTIARQKNDDQWLSRVERLIARTLSALAEMGLTEIPAADCTFDERTHEVVGALENTGRESFLVADVLARGFRFQGAVLRRSQVVITR